MYTLEDLFKFCIENDASVTVRPSAYAHLTQRLVEVQVDKGIDHYKTLIDSLCSHACSEKIFEYELEHALWRLEQMRKERGNG